MGNKNWTPPGKYSLKNGLREPSPPPQICYWRVCDGLIALDRIFIAADIHRSSAAFAEKSMSTTSRGKRSARSFNKTRPFLLGCFAPPNYIVFCTRRCLPPRRRRCRRRIRLRGIQHARRGAYGTYTVSFIHATRGTISRARFACVPARRLQRLYYTNGVICQKKDISVIIIITGNVDTVQPGSIYCCPRASGFDA